MMRLLMRAVLLYSNGSKQDASHLYSLTYINSFCKLAELRFTIWRR